MPMLGRNDVPNTVGIFLLVGLSLAMPVIQLGLGVLGLAIQMISALGVSFLIWKMFLKGDWNSVRFYVLVFFVFYFLIVLSGQIFEAFLEYKVRQMDADGDTFLSPSEQAKVSIDYFGMQVNGLGRSLLFITGAIYSFVFTMLVALAGAVWSKARKRG
jgi:hypothetical protein